MKKILPIIIAALTLACGAKAQTTLFDSKSSSGSSKAYYRIPAILTDKDGTLWAFSDDRTGVTDAKAWGDIGSVGSVSIIARKSTDNGSNWGTATTIAEGLGTTNTSCETYEMAHGDASVVCDRESGDILMMCASGNTRFGESTSSNPLRVAKYYYDASTGTWSHSEVTSQIYNLSSASGIFFTSGKMCQSRLIKKGSHYRIYASLTTLNMVNQVIYSDDFGSTWNVLSGGSTLSPTDDDEAKLVELPNGNVLYSARMTGGRYFNIYTYSDDTYTSGSWGSCVSSTSTSGGTAAQNNSTNGDILVVPALENGDESKPVYIALQSVPYGSSTSYSENVDKRCNVSIYWKVLSSKEDFDSPSDFASGWTRHSVTTGKSAYSALAVTNDKNIAILYEDEGVRLKVESDYMEIYDIIFRKYALEDIATTSSTSAKAVTRATTTSYTYSTLSEDAHWAAFSGESSGSTDSGDETEETTDPWVGKIVTLQNLFSSTNSATNTTLKRYLRNNGLTLTLEQKDETATPDYTYYWVISKDPSGSYYYLSSMNGDGYMGWGNATPYNNDGNKVVAGGGAACTDNYKGEFQVQAFQSGTFKFSGSTANGTNYTQTAYAIPDGAYNIVFNILYNDYKEEEQRVLTIAEDGTINWSVRSANGVYETLNQKYWSSAFKITEVGKATSVNNYGTFASPTHFGFPVKMTRSDTGKGDTNFEGYYYYATLKLPFAVDLSSAKDASGTSYDVEVLKCTTPRNKPSEEVELTDITNTLTDNTLPRETPVILRMGTKETPAYDAAQITLYFQPALAQDIITTTGLKGSLGKKTFQNTKSTEADYYDPTKNANFFILGKKADGRIKFYYLSDLNLAANKAYYVYEGTASSKSIVFRFADDDISTGITLPEAIEADDNAVIYDLSGRRVSSAVKKGIYIRDGKKYVVK
ncbi:MAG: sialidase family protein [Prevotella sp.]